MVFLVREALKLKGVRVLRRQAENSHPGKGGRPVRQAKKMDWFEKNDWYGWWRCGLRPSDGVRT